MSNFLNRVNKCIIVPSHWLLFVFLKIVTGFARVCLREKRETERERQFCLLALSFLFFVCVSFSCVHFVVILCLNLLVNTIERLPLFYLSFNDFSLNMALP